MGDKKSPDVWKVSPPQHLQLCLTLRDEFGWPIEGMSFKAMQNGKELKAVGGTSPRTDDAGRVVLVDVDPGTITVTLDARYVPDDSADVRNGVAQKYMYSPLGSGIPLQVQAVASSSGDLPFLDQTRAYVTVFCGMSKWTPRFRFPWQNPVHRDPTVKNGLYAKREEALRHTILAFGVTKAEAASLGQDALVARLVELYKAGRLPGGGVAAPTPGEGTYTGSPPVVPEDPDPAEPPPSSRPLSNDVRAVERNLKVEGSEDPPAPAAPPPAPPHAAGLAPWAWYMIFHYCGLTYGNAHGTYINPARLLEAFTNDMASSKWPAKSTVEPTKEDVTEAFVLTCSVDATRLLGPPASVRSWQAKLTSSKPAVASGALLKVFAALAKLAMLRFTKISSTDGSPQGDYTSLGLLRARHLRKPWDGSDLDAVTWLTAWRNDATAAAAFTVAVQDLKRLFSRKHPTVLDAVQKGFVEAWKDRNFESLDLVTTSLVCNQTTEVAEHARGQRLDKMIADNALDAQRNGQLRPLLKADADACTPGDHLFFVGYRSPKDLGGDHPGTHIRTSGWYLTKQKLIPIEKVTALDMTLGDLVRDDDFLHLYERKTRKKGQKPMENVTRVSAASVPDGVYTVNLAKFTGKSSKEDTAFVRLLTTKEQDVERDETGNYHLLTEPDPDRPNKVRKVMVDVRRVGIMVWSHEEMVVARNVNRLYTFTTAAAGTDGLTALRTFDLNALHEAAFIGRVHTSEKARPELGWFLDTHAL